MRKIVEWKRRVRQWEAGRRRRGFTGKAMTHNWLGEQVKKDPVCIYCKVTLTPDNAALDHIIPLAKNGSDELENYQIICQPCNKAKGSFDAAFFADLITYLHWQKNDLELLLRKLRAAWRVR